MSPWRLLIIDDSEQTKALLQLYFGSNYDMTFASDGSEGLDLIASKEGFDLIFLDLIMPGMDGFEFLRRYKKLKLNPEPPVIVLTASYSREDELKAFQCGATDFVSKPFEPSILIRKAEVSVSS